MTSWPADRVERWALDKLIPYARNARTHSDEQVAQIAASIREWGWTNPVLVDEGGQIIAGHGRILAARQLGLSEAPVMVAAGWTDAQKRAYLLADNKLALNAGWDDELLRLELGELKELGFDVGLTGFTESEFEALTPETEPPGEPDKVPELSEPVSVLGDVWICGPHRVMCGDSLSVTAVERLMAGKRAQLMHADPPYGMGKAAEGVANDNIYGADLDRFQMEWWATWRTFLADNASAYIWGNAPDLWRLWYCGGLADSERLELRNEIVWDKKGVAGMASPDLTQYPEATERCLFFQIGQQFLGNINTADFPESWEPTRAYMAGEAQAAGMKAGDVKRVCGVSMWGHWFTRSQFYLIAREHYERLAAAYPGHFLRPWDELNREWQKVRGGPTSEIQGARSYFNNAHDVMRDVWEFPRVSGEERLGHATPKPVAMIERVMRSSLQDGELCVEPFGGTGTTLMAAERTRRVCYTMELQPRYVDVILRRWQEGTGEDAVLEGDGRTFLDIEEARARPEA